MTSAEARSTKAPTARVESRSRAAVGMVAGLAIGLATGPLRAEPAEPAALGWVRESGADSCIGAVALAEAVEARLGRPALVSAARAKVSVEGRIAPAEGEVGWRVSLTVADATGKVLGRRFLSRETADCHALDEDIVLTVALLVDPEAALSAPPSAPPSAPQPIPRAPKDPLQTPEVPPPAPRCPPAVPAPSSPVRSWNTVILVGPVGSIGALPSAGLGAELRVLVTPVPRFAFQIGGSVWAPQKTSFGDAGGEFFLAMGALSVCPLTGVALGLRYAACAGAEAGTIRAGGFGFPLTSQHDDPVVNGVLEARVVRKIVGPFAASVGAGLSVPFLRHQYYYVDAGGAEREVFLTSPVAATLDLLVGFDL